jgi:hypothetical protein
MSGPISQFYRSPLIPPSGAFSDYLAALTPWESLLFHSLAMKAFPNKMVSLVISNIFRGASDRYFKFLTHGSFGWSLSLPNGRRLATCSGPVYGAKRSSYHAESYGMLSLLHFFIHLFEYCNTQQDTDGVIVCDILSLINKVIAFQSPFPNSAALLDNDWTPFDSFPTQLSNTSSSAVCKKASPHDGHPTGMPLETKNIKFIMFFISK